MFSISISIGGEPVGPDAEAAIRERFGKFVAEVQAEHDVTIHAATLEGEHGSEEPAAEDGETA